VTDEARQATVVVDTNVFGATLLERTAWLVDLYRPVIRGRMVVISFQTLGELHFGAVRRGWGQARVVALEARIATSEVVHSTTALATAYAGLRAECERAGHGLAQRDHDADRWIAATAMHLGVPLVSHDAIFRGVPGLVFETALHG
jgi:predicted nucleic acid-binding protein